MEVLKAVKNPSTIREVSEFGAPQGELDNVPKRRKDDGQMRMEGKGVASFDARVGIHIVGVDAEVGDKE